MKTTIERARAYLAKLPPAVSGQGGHAVTFRAACTLVRFGLADHDVLTLLQEFNTRCLPPWSPAELRHKLAEARKVAGSVPPRMPPPVRSVWKVQPRQAPAAPAPNGAARPPFRYALVAQLRIHGLPEGSTGNGNALVLPCGEYTAAFGEWPLQPTEQSRSTKRAEGR